MDLPHLPGLSPDEQVAFIALVRHLIHADGRVSDEELYDLVEVGAGFDPEDFADAMAATEPILRDRAGTLALAASVLRPNVQRGILSVLERIAEGDGVHISEITFLAEVRAVWQI